MARPCFMLFAAIGGFASLVNLLARIAIDRVASFEVAIVGAFCVALVTAFLLNRALVFRQAAAGWHGQFARFLLVNLLALVQIVVVTELLAKLVFPAIGWTLWRETVAHAIGLLTPLATSFTLHQRFTFARAVA